MRELETVQKQELLNRVFSVDEKGNGGANHKYMIVADIGLSKPKETIIQFQHGPRSEDDSTHGVLGCDLLEVVRDTIKGFQSGPYSSKENEEVLYHVEQALFHMNKRVEDRINRKVLGKNQK